MISPLSIIKEHHIISYYEAGGRVGVCDNYLPLATIIPQLLQDVVIRYRALDEIIIMAMKACAKQTSKSKYRISISTEEHKIVINYD